MNHSYYIYVIIEPIDQLSYRLGASIYTWGTSECSEGHPSAIGCEQGGAPVSAIAKLAGDSPVETIGTCGFNGNYS